MRILKIESLPDNKNWVDKDRIMLHACFQLLKDCVEQEKVLEHCNYETHKDFVDEGRFLYEWWLRHDDTKGTTLEEEKEEREMLQRLINIREFLWT